MLISLVAIHPSPSPQAVPLANAFLKAYSGAFARQVELFDFFLDRNPSECAAQLLSGHPRAIGFSLYLWNREACRAVAREVRRLAPATLIFAGGPEVTADPGGVLAEGVLDLVITGEGELPFAGLCERLASGGELSGIPGIVLPGEPPGKAHPPLADLDAIPSPWLNGILDARRYPGILWQLSRGCGFGCDFCFDSRDNLGVRRFSLERAEAELRCFADSGVTQVFVLDSTFNQDAKRAKTVLRMIRKIAPRIHFHFEVRSEFIDREMAQLFAEITCSLQIGLQSADPGVLKNVGRAFRRDDFSKRIGMLNESGATFGFDLIYGLPGDTLAGFRDSLDFSLSLYPNHLDIFPLAVLPGTPLAARSDAIGLRHRHAPPYTSISSPGFSPEDMDRAHRLAAACDIFYSRGRAVAWFNSVVRALELPPSSFLSLFSDWLATGHTSAICEADLDDDRIWQLQRGFLSHLLTRKRVKRLLPLVLDLIDYHHHYAAALMTPPPGFAGERPLEARPLDLSWRLPPSTRLATFHYEILDILDAGEPDIRAFSAHFRATGSFAIIYPAPDGIRTESVSAHHYRLLAGMDGRTPAGRISRGLGIPNGEAVAFLQFAAAEGIIIPRQSPVEI